jgi:ketosteroid isomerase-like protein
MTRFLVAVCLLATVALALPPRVMTQQPRSADADVVAAITKIEQTDVPKADLASDVAFYTNLLAEDWTGGTSRGTWDSKASLLADLKDTKNNKTNSETVSDVKVRVHGDIAIATYKTTYDAMIKGEHYARTVISTDTFQRQNGAWKVLAGHSSQAAAK